MEFFRKNLGVTWWHKYQHHSCIKEWFGPKKNLANFMIAPPTTDFINERIINNYALCCHTQCFRDIIKSLQDPTTAKYVPEPLAPGTACINILLENICNSVIDPSSITYKDTVVPWYMDLLLHSRSATDTTGIENKIFQAFRVTSPTHTT
jgi:hypothetical protein